MVTSVPGPASLVSAGLLSSTSDELDIEMKVAGRKQNVPIRVRK